MASTNNPNIVLNLFSIGERLLREYPSTLSKMNELELDELVYTNNKIWAIKALQASQIEGVDSYTAKVEKARQKASI